MRQVVCVWFDLVIGNWSKNFEVLQFYSKRFRPLKCVILDTSALHNDFNLSCYNSVVEE